MINSFLAQIFENIHGGSKEVGIALMIAALCELPGMIFFEQLVKKKSSKFWLSVASISFAVRGFMMLLASSILMMEMTHLLQAFSFALFIPASAYLFNQFLADGDRKCLGRQSAAAFRCMGDADFRYWFCGAGCFINYFGHSKNTEVI